MQEPFKKVILDVVGPLPTCESGNRFILTIMDMASHYPIAIPIQDHTAKTICDALIQVFSNHGFPEEIREVRAVSAEGSAADRGDGILSSRADADLGR